AGRAGDVGDRPGSRSRRGRRRAAARSRRRADQGGHGVNLALPSRSAKDWGEAYAADGALTTSDVVVAGTALVLDPAGALYWPEERALVVSDLHLEKGSSFAARGVLLPPFDTTATLDRLAD